MPTCKACGATFAEGTTVCPNDNNPLVSDPPLEPGTAVGEYRIERLLGAGTFGDVYAAVHPVIGKRVAVKLLRRELSAHQEVVQRFIAEARAIARIHHRNIVDVFSFGTLDGDHHYYVMELLDGRTLGDLLDREQRLAPAQALPILRGVAAALDAAHEAGVVHRDVKPDNIFLVQEKDGTYTPKLVDFGVAKLFTDEMGVKTATGVAIGTPRYMSPEQCRGKNVDHRSDIYALGVLAHEMLTGSAPFRGDALVDLMLKHTVEPPPRMSSVRPDLPPSLDAPVLAMLAKKPSERPPSAGRAIADLAEQMRGAPHSRTLPLGTIVMEQQAAPEPAEPRNAGAPTVRDAAPPAAFAPVPQTVLLEGARPARVVAGEAPTMLERPGPVPPTKVSGAAGEPAPPPSRVDSPSMMTSAVKLPTSNGPAIAAAVIALALVAGGAFAFFGRRTPAAPPPAAATARPTAVATAPAPTAPAETAAATVEPASAPAPTAVASTTAAEPPAPKPRASSPAPAAPSPAPRPPAKPAQPAGKSHDIGF